MKVNISIGRHNLGNGWTGPRWRFNLTVKNLAQAKQTARSLAMVIGLPVSDITPNTGRGVIAYSRKV